MVGTLRYLQFIIINICCGYLQVEWWAQDIYNRISNSCSNVGRCGVVSSTLAFGSTGCGFESEQRAPLILIS